MTGGWAKETRRSVLKGMWCKKRSHDEELQSHRKSIMTSAKRKERWKQDGCGSPISLLEKM
jgi:hypothetical protein